MICYIIRLFFVYYTIIKKLNILWESVRFSSQICNAIENIAKHLILSLFHHYAEEVEYNTGFAPQLK